MSKTFTIYNFGFKSAQKPWALHSRHKHNCRVKYHSWASVRLQQMLGQKINDYRPWKSIVIQDHVALYKDLPLSDHRSPQLSGKQDPQVPQMKGQQQLPKLPRRCRESSTHSRASHQEHEWPHSSPCEWAVLQQDTGKRIPKHTARFYKVNVNQYLTGNSSTKWWSFATTMKSRNIEGVREKKKRKKAS